VRAKAAIVCSSKRIEQREVGSKCIAMKNDTNCLHEDLSGVFASAGLAAVVAIWVMSNINLASR
jgi:hypothetical protein